MSIANSVPVPSAPRVRARPGRLVFALALAMLAAVLLDRYDRPALVDAGARLVADSAPAAVAPAMPAVVLAAPQPEPARSTVPDAEARLRIALMLDDYTAALHAFAEAWSTLSAEELADLRELLLEHASDLIQARDYRAATTLLDAYLAAYYNDVDAMVLAARASREAGQFPRAIDRLLGAMLYEMRPGVAHTLETQLSWTVSLHVQHLREQGDFAAVAEIYARMTQHVPDNPHYFIALAQAYLDVARVSDALAALRHVQYAQEVGRQARELIARIGEGA